MASFNEAWMLNKVTGEFFLTKNGFSQSITMANGPSQWRQGTCSDQKGNWVRYWFSGNRWFLEPQPSEEKWTPPLEGELLWLDPADYQMKLAWGEFADCAAFEPEAALAPPASAGGRLAREPASRPGLAAVLGCFGLLVLCQRFSYTCIGLFFICIMSGCRLFYVGTWSSGQGSSSVQGLQARSQPHPLPVPRVRSLGHGFNLQGGVAACWFFCWLPCSLAFGHFELTAFEPEASLALPASAGGRLAREPASRPGLAAVQDSFGQRTWRGIR